MVKEMSFEQIEELVDDYQAGSKKAANRLINAYYGYIQKLTNVLIEGKPFNIRDKTQRSFIKLFMKDSAARRHINKYKKSGAIVQEVERTLYQVRTALDIEDEWEIKNELIILFLDMAMKHDKSGLFGGYINDYFTLRASTLIVQMMKGKVQRNYHEIELLDHDNPIDVNYDTEDDSYLEILGGVDTDFDENWINGDTCGEIFSPLTPYERRLIKWHYEWKTYRTGVSSLPSDIMKERRERFRLTDSDIADLLGCSRKTVVMKRKEAVDCIETLSLQLNNITR